MSFLELEDDPQATLAVALAFIDACEEHDDGTSHSSSSEGHWSADDDDDDDADVVTTDSHVQQQSPPPPPQSLTVFIRDNSLSGYLPHHHQKQQQQQQQQARRSQTGKMTKSRAHSVKKHRERKKHEVATLREQAAQLEAKLARLQHSSATYGNGSRHSAAHRQLMRLNTRQEKQQHQVLVSQLQKSESWLEVAALREIERFQSEALNMKLKDALRRQIIATKALEGVLSKKKTEGLELLSDHQKEKLRSHNANGDNHMIIRTAPPAVETASLLVRLQTELQQMYLLTDLMVMNYGPSENEWVAETAPSSSSSSCVLHANPEDVGSAMFTEMRTTTFVRCSFQEAGQVMWQDSSPKQSTSQTGKNVVVRQALTSSSFQKCFSLVLEDPDRTTPVGLYGTAYMHKFEEANRFMFIWTSSITMADNGPKFIEKGWIVATPCPKQSTEGRPASIVRMCYQAFSCPEAQGAEASSSLCSVKDPETRQKMAFLIKWLSRKTRNYNQQMENVFLDKY